MEFAARASAYQARVAAALERWLPAQTDPPARLHQAMRYAVLGGGKRVRPLLMYASGELLGIEPARLDGPAAAVEMIHAYSLIHDDLPAMDDDDLRRGRPTCHRAFDEATAILAGDALQALAFEVLSCDIAMQADDAARVRMVSLLAVGGGSRGMAGGQAIDLESERMRLDIGALESMHRLKTGALIRAAIMIPVALAGPGVDDALERYAAAIGLAFQVRDDILDVEADTTVLGKAQGADIMRDKSTFPALMGMEGAKARVAELRDDALAALEPFGDAAAPLAWVADYIVDRNF